MWHQTQNKEYLDLCLHRMKGPVLIWVEQFLDILQLLLPLNQRLTLNDIGCNVGQFAKGLKERGIKIGYRGFDIEPLYLAEARKIFPASKKRFCRFDISKEIPPLTDISIVSATLEHLENLSPGLDHILLSTKKIALVRTFLGEKRERGWLTKKGAKRPYRTNQYSFKEALDLFHKYAFETKVVRDRYTDSLPKYLPIETSPGRGIVRTQYVIIGEKKQNP